MWLMCVTEMPTLSASTPARGGSSSSGSARRGSSGSSGDEQVATHTHTWKNHTATRQVRVSNWVTVPDHETETYVDYQYCDCGATR